MAATTSDAKKKSTGVSRTKLLLGLAVVVAAGVVTRYVWAANANEKARVRVDAACVRIEAGLEQRFAAQEAFVAYIFAEDAPRAKELLSSRLRPTCQAVRAELSGSKWNVDRTFRAPPADDAELEGIMERARPRCRTAFLGTLAEVDRTFGGEGAITPEMEERADEMCAAFAASGARPTDEGPPPSLLEGWPAQLEALATAIEQSQPKSAAVGQSAVPLPEATAPAP